MDPESTQLQQAQLAAILGPDSAPFEIVISHLMSTSNELRSQAESLFNLCKQTDPDSLTLKLAHLLQSSPHVEARAMSAILLRKQLTRDDSYLWPRLTDSTRSSLKSILLSCIQREDSKSISKKLCDTVSELASGILPENGWPELLPFMFQCVSSDSPKLQESAFLIFAQLSQYIGDTLAPHIKHLHAVFLQCLTTSPSSDVKIAALNAAINFIQCLSNSADRDRFQDLLPAMMTTLTEALNNGNDATAQEALELLIELAGTEPRFLRRQLVDVVGSMLQIAEAEALEEGTRHLAIEFVITLAEARERAPGMMRKLPQFISRLFAILMKMLLDIEDDPAWHSAESEEEDAGETSNYSVAQECLDRLSISLGGNTIVPVASEQLPGYLAAPEWQKHHAALVALAQIAEGCAKVMIKNLDHVVAMVLTSFQDPHPRVRWAAINAIGQLSTDLGPDLQVQYHGQVLPALASAMDDFQNPRVQAHAASAVLNFSENCTPDILTPYLDGIVSKLLVLLQNGKQMVQEGALTALASVADSSQEHFQKYYDAVMPYLKAILVNATDKSNRMLRAKSMECISLVGMAVGKEKFRDDAKQVMEVLMSLQGSQLETDDPTTSYMLQAWARLCKCLGQDFLPYMSVVMPPLLQLGCNIDGNLDDTKFSQPMPWIGLYVAAASLAFLISMAADVIQGIRRQKFWFPCKFSSLNATSLTLLAVATKLSVDLNTSMPRRQDQLAKLSSTILISTVMGNSMPSLGTMENSDMFMNIVALGILVITVIVNVCIQLATGVIYVFLGEHVFIMFIMIVLLLLLGFSALTVPNTKQYLELKYNKRHQLALKEGSNETGTSVVDKLRKDLMKYWVMAHTGSPQFVMARSVTSTASGAFCLLSAATLAQAMLRSHFMPWSFKFCSGESDYHWSTTLVLVTQTIAVGIGTVGPACRWFIAINFSSPKRGNKTGRKSFKVENYWIQSLVEMKECPFTLLGIRNRHCRKLAHDAKDHFLNLCIGVQIGIVLMSKGIQFISIFFVSWILSCCHCCKGLLKFRFRNAESASESQPNSKPDLSRFVLHLAGEDAMVGMVKRNCDPTDYWFRMGEKRRPKYLIKLLERSSQEFKGVVEFDSNQVPSLDSEEPPNCWALPVVTLASIAVVLPNMSPKLIEELICSVNEGMMYVRLVENNLDTRKEFINIRRAAEGVWVRVELYRKWLDVDLHKLSLQAKSPREALQKLSDTAKNNLVEFHKNHTPQCLKHGPSKWPIKVLAANSMYRITQTMLLNRKSGDDQIGEKLFEAVAVMISDILGACLTNLQRFISAKSLSSSIEEREDSVRHAVHILGKAEKILKLQQRRALPGLDPHQMASIDEWRSFYMQKPLPFNPSPSESEAASNSVDLYLTIDQNQ